ncbi:hypothetical protein [Rhodococcus opacus]|uniref:hypothetical protein n=1 Tax=Rhodococcus opacus TaxID=37919 RepID=UPI002948F4CC|nr:hypothetical protein [Rhodococcus opacus]MDV6247236.1 hypothetical protein [Rhodococcus opacus]
MTEQAEQATLREGYKALSARVHSYLGWIQEHDVSPDSDMARDDEFMAPFRRTFRESVTQTLASALDHLRLVGESLERQPEPNPYAPSSLIRTAITGAATSLWLMTGDKEQRRFRALEFNYKDHLSYRHYLVTSREERKFNSQAQHDFDAEIERLDVRCTDLLEVAQQLWLRAWPERNPLTRAVFKSGTSDTNMVKEAGALIDTTNLDGWDPSIQVARHWMMLSGYAHARPWATAPHKTWGLAQSNGMASVTIQMDPNMLLDSAYTAIQVAEAALNRYKTLST